MSNSLWPHGLYSPWNSLGQNTEVGSLSLLQGILPIQGSNTGLPYSRLIFYQLSHKGSPRLLEWVAYPFSSGSPWPRNQSGVSCIAGRFLYQLSYGIHITFTWTGKSIHFYDSLNFDSHIITDIWNWICNISEVCLYKHTYIHTHRSKVLTEVSIVLG